MNGCYVFIWNLGGMEKLLYIFTYSLFVVTGVSTLASWAELGQILVLTATCCQGFEYIKLASENTGTAI